MTAAAVDTTERTNAKLEGLSRYASNFDPAPESEVEDSEIHENHASIFSRVGDAMERWLAETGGDEDMAFAEAYMEVQLEIEGKAERMKQQVERIIANILRERDSLEHVFQEAMRDVSKRLIAAQKGKKKSINLIMGTPSFRSTPGSLKVTDEGMAVKWLTMRNPKAVRLVPATKAVDKKVALEWLREYREESLENTIPNCFEVKEPSESFKIAAAKPVKGKAAQPGDTA